MRYRVAKEYAPLTYEKAPVAGGNVPMLSTTLPMIDCVPSEPKAELPMAVKLFTLGKL
jgi:hypothetical protein